MPLLYVLCREWMHERDLLAAASVQRPDRLDDLLTGPAMTARGGRAAQVAAMGGEV